MYLLRVYNLHVKLLETVYTTWWGLVLSLVKKWNLQRELDETSEVWGLGVGVLVPQWKGYG